MIVLALMACADVTTVQPLVDARAAEIGVAAAPGVRLGVAAGSLGAWLCSLDQTDLRELAQDPDTGAAVPTLTAPADLAANLAIEAPGTVFWNTATGVTTLSYEGSLDSVQALDIEVVITTPTQAFELSFRDPEGEGYSASATVKGEDCSASPRVSVVLDLDVDDDAIKVVLPQGEGELLDWNSGQFAPQTGTASWSTGSGVDKQSWLADDAEGLEGDAWPGTASSADWSAAATVVIARPDAQ